MRRICTMLASPPARRRQRTVVDAPQLGSNWQQPPSASYSVSEASHGATHASVPAARGQGCRRRGGEDPGDRLWPVFRGRAWCAGTAGRAGAVCVRERRLPLCAEPWRAAGDHRSRLRGVAALPRAAAGAEAEAAAQSEQHRLHADERLGAGRVAGAQGDQAEPERELLHQPRSRCGSSGRAGRQFPCAGRTSGRTACPICAPT